MAKKKIRDAEYYRKRLARDFPAIYAGLLAKKYKSVHAAATAAGLKRLPTGLDALKRAWKRATPIERADFDDWAKAGAKTVARPTAATLPIADPSGRLRADVQKFLANWLVSTNSRPARIMKEMGLSGFNVTLSGAIRRGEPVREHIVRALERWLPKNGFR